MLPDTTKIKIGDVEYIRADSATPDGNRAIVVVDRGWIFAGDVTDKDGRIYIDRAVLVFKWREIGFDGVVANPSSDKVDIRRLQNRVDIPAGAEVFRIPVSDDWGL